MKKCEDDAIRRPPQVCVFGSVVDEIEKALEDDLSSNKGARSMTAESKLRKLFVEVFPIIVRRIDSFVIVLLIRYN